MSTIPGLVKALSRATAADSDAADVSFGDAFVFNTTLMVPGPLGANLVAPVPNSVQPADQSGTDPSVIDSGPTGGVVPASETVTLAGSQLVFVNTYLAGVTDAYRTAVLFAEHELQSHFSNNVTITVSFGFANLSGFLAQNSFHNQVQASYTSLRNALQAHATTPDDFAAVNSLSGLADPSGGGGFLVGGGMARLLGLAGAPGPQPDVQLVLGNGFTWNFDPNNRGAANGYDAIGAIEHEISEGGFGRVGGLGDQNHTWGPMDLFRYSSVGHRDFTDGRDGLAAYFSVDGTQLLTRFHNSAPNGVLENPISDPADWDIGGDSFGFGGKGVIGLLSSVDLRVLDILGWTPTGSTPSTVDDFRNSLTDTTHPFGSVAVNGSSTGTLEVTGDRDWFHVQLVAGTPYVITVTGQQGGGGTLEDSYLRVHNSVGTLLTENDDIVLGVNRDSQLTFTPTTSGTYYLDVGAFNDGYAGTYRIGVVATPTDDFRDSLTDTTRPFGFVAVNGSGTGNLEVNGDRDWFQVQLAAGATYVIDLQGVQAGGGTLVDPYLRVHNSVGTLLAENDDIVLGINRDSELTFTATAAGTYYLEAGAFDDSYTGTYKVSVTGVANSVSISDVSISEGDSGTKIETFTVTRTGGSAAFDVNFGTADGTATIADHDYVANAGTLHFGAGVNTQTISVTINGDTKLENSETFFVNLSGATNGFIISDNSALGTIANDEGTRSPHEFNGDGKNDFLWRNDSGAVATWNMNDRSSSGAVIASVTNDWHIADTGDFNGDGRSDILWRNDSGAVATWNMNDRSSAGLVIGSASNDWHIAGTGDFNGDHKTDILWRNDNGSVATWDMNDRSANGAVIASASNDWHIAGTGDFNGDGKTDILWRNDSGAVATWDMNDRIPNGAVIANVSNDWHIAGTGDFNGDGKTDILWRNDNGAVATWDMNDRSSNGAVIATVTNDWHIAETGDFNGDHKTDILWRNDSGAVATWDMNDRSYSGLVIAPAANDWHIV